MTAAATTVANEVEPYDAGIAQKIRDVQGLVELEENSIFQFPLPANPVDSLIAEINALSLAVGFDQDATLAVLASGLTPDMSGRLATVLDKMFACNGVTEAHFATLTIDVPTVYQGAGLDAADFADVRPCADDLWESTADLEFALNTAILSPVPRECTPLGDVELDVWPVIKVDGACTNNEYRNDYLLLVEVGGHDTYVNNVGSNMVDFNFAPEGNPVPGLGRADDPDGFGDARGCQRAIPGLVAADCTPSVAVLIDMQGEDTFGVKQTPAHDIGCTNDLLVRRMVTVGVGFLGVGILLDSDNHNDHYTGKTGSTGTGHIFGVGILLDRGGNDVYSAIRNSLGFSLVGGLGVLRDEGGSDRYERYMPAPIDPSAGNQEEGAGGARDDEGEGLCDRIPRFVQGAANVGTGPTIGVLVDTGGNDFYSGAFVAGFLAPANLSASSGSQGFGSNAATGVFLDRGGSDTYSNLDEVLVTGAAGRTNGAAFAGASGLIVCDANGQNCQEVGDSTTANGSNGGEGAFIDRA